jgi:putative transposase
VTAKVITSSNAPAAIYGERPVLKLMYAALIRGAERWRGIHLSVFETRQLEAIHHALDEEHRRRHVPPSRSSEAKSPSQISSKLRT